MKRIKTSFSLTPKTKHLIDILANKLELSKSAVISLAIQDYSGRIQDYSDHFDIGTGKVTDEVINLIEKDDVISIQDAIGSFYAILIELEKRKITDRGTDNEL